MARAGRSQASSMACCSGDRGIGLSSLRACVSLSVQDRGAGGVPEGEALELAGRGVGLPGREDVAVQLGALPQQDLLALGQRSTRRGPLGDDGGLGRGQQRGQAVEAQRRGCRGALGSLGLVQQRRACPAEARAFIGRRGGLERLEGQVGQFQSQREELILRYRATVLPRRLLRVAASSVLVPTRRSERSLRPGVAPAGSPRLSCARGAS